MNTLHSYEDMGIVRKDYVPESYSGTQIVQWYGNIERQLTRMEEENKAARNFAYADKIRTFLESWRTHEITGSLNRDTIEVLKVASEQLAVDSWNLGNYFSNLRDQLRKLMASEEELPRVASQPDDKAMGPGAGAGRGAMPPMSPEFGPDKEQPGEGMPTEPGPENQGPEGEELPGEESPNRKFPPPPRARM